MDSFQTIKDTYFPFPKSIQGFRKQKSSGELVLEWYERETSMEFVRELWSRKNGMSYIYFCLFFWMYHFNKVVVVSSPVDVE